LLALPLPAREHHSVHRDCPSESGNGDIEYALTAAVLVMAVVLILLATPLGDVVQQLIDR
jgi:hypothetical protein